MTETDHRARRTRARLTRWLGTRRRVAGLIAGVLAVAMFGVGIVFTVNVLGFLIGSVGATGEVVAVETVRTPDGREQPQVVVEYPDRNGLFRRVTAESPSEPPPEVGTDLGVLYDPDRPSEAVINDPSQLWRGVVASGSLAFVLGVLAEELLRGSRRVGAEPKVPDPTRPPVAGQA
ncbi:DUF3592 domain-containing protein [Granulicoccus phenolivorans]|uniref:DUF3592 domain-containing protein n=1 Tax=Granulicoccus phenolivorans TaxID=266854 RepID=UPI0004046769|nr:DUF3592 domain-containing protein [Granulicoccus phenolivorans]